MGARGFAAKWSDQPDLPTTADFVSRRGPAAVPRVVQLREADPNNHRLAHGAVKTHLQLPTSGKRLVAQEGTSPESKDERALLKTERRCVAMAVVQWSRHDRLSLGRPRPASRAR